MRAADNSNWLFVVAGGAKCAVSVTHDEMSFFSVQRIMAGKTANLTVHENHLGVSHQRLEATTTFSWMTSYTDREGIFLYSCDKTRFPKPRLHDFRRGIQFIAQGAKLGGININDL